MLSGLDAYSFGDRHRYIGCLHGILICFSSRKWVGINFSFSTEVWFSFYIFSETLSLSLASMLTNLFFL